MKRIIIYGSFLTFLLTLFLPCTFAQEKKPFPAYVEFSFPFLLNDQGFLDSYESNITFKGRGKSNGTTEIEQLQFQTISLGWEFPRKGKIIVTYTNFTEDNSDTVINHSVLGENGYLPDENYDPNPFDGNYDTDAAHYLLKIMGGDLGMKTTTYDAVFARSFGKGKRFGGLWNAGLRYATHQQKLPMGYFYTYIDPDFGFAHTYFSSNPMLIDEESSYVGPKGGGEIHLFLFNKRIVLSAGVDLSLMFGNNKVPTQYYPRLKGSYDEFYNLIINEDMFPYSDKRSRTPFFSTIDFNVKFRIFKELYAFVGYKYTDFRDIFLVPTLVDLPTAKDVAPYGLFISFAAEDVIYQTPYAGISYQF